MRGALSETGRESQPGDRETGAGFFYAPSRWQQLLPFSGDRE